MAACVWAEYRAELNKIIVGSATWLLPEISQLRVRMGESYHLHCEFRHIYILHILVPKVVQSAVWEFFHYCWLHLHFLFLRMVHFRKCWGHKKHHKFIKINHTQLNPRFSSQYWGTISWIWTKKLELCEISISIFRTSPFPLFLSH